MYRMKVFVLVLCVLFTGIQGGPDRAVAEESGNSWVCKVISVQGRVLLKRYNQIDWRPAGLDDHLYPGDRIRVEADSRAGIVLSNDAVLRLDQNTTMVFTTIEKPAVFLLELLKGAANFFSRRPRSLKVVTPFVNGVVEGTEFYVRVTLEHTRIDLFEGRILAENRFGALKLTAGQGVEARPGRAPQPRILVHSRDSVQWALYYPPILAGGENFDSNELDESLQLYYQGRLAEALERMQSVPTHQRNAPYYTYRAGLLINVGRVDQALIDIRKALAMDPGNSDAKALEAVVAVVQNRKTDALRTAQEAVQSDPDGSAARIALSYAHQAGFNLEAALQAAQAAVARDPESGIAWARLAELRLCIGEVETGINAAQKAVTLNPYGGHAHTVLGFAYLTRMETERARNAFHKAIALDSAAPLPRLGLGLAEIRDGRLKQGRSEIEIAAGLDPGSALIRSYLGKAYFDEKRGPLDEHQFEIAKQLDPNDPTPWFYDAIRKQTLNRPGEALQDLQKSIELNDNRAVYRSRLMLDEDLAARSAGIGRIYSNLGFEEIALRRSWDSLNIEPSNHSAHRLLADMYASRPHHEIARVSELLQSQLFQPLNLTPIQPQLAESSFIAPQGTGISNISLYEFNPLFAGNRVTLQANAVSGDQRTWAEDVTLAGIYKSVSFSAGQYHYETDGFRPNNDVTRDMYDFFIQARLQEKLSLQFEYRDKKTDNGDLIQNFYADDFSDDLREERNERIPRFGLHYTPDADQHFVMSFILNHTDYSLGFTEEEDSALGPLLWSRSQEDEIDAHNVEFQYLLQRAEFNIILGCGNYQQNSETDFIDTVTFFGEAYPFDESKDVTAHHDNAYLYSILSVTPHLKATLGVSGDSFKKNNIEVDQINPKIGLNWRPSGSLTIRASAFRTLKRSLVTNQTIEPTQVAGFNQFFDDPLATDAKRYGLGIDYRIRPDLFLGLELTYGDLTIPIENFSTAAVREEKQDENTHRFYLYWLATPQLSACIDYRYEYYAQEPENPGNLVKNLRTHFLPVGVNYFHPSGFYAKIQCQYINQRIEQYAGISELTETDEEDFITCDASVGYRLPNRYGILGLSITNLFDEEFRFFDGNFATGTSESPSIRPERQILLKATLSF